jgi:hypothetical protein
MISLLVALTLAQDVSCSGEAAMHAMAASARAEAFDLAGATDAYVTAADLGCADADAAAHYLRGLIAAREAYRQGGSAESLEPVKKAAAVLEARAAARPGRAEIARVVLLAAAAASQSERDEMALLIEHAVSLEALQLAAGQPGAPGVTAHEVGGDLWLQVHRYDEARQFYRRAAERLGATPRIRLGLARTAARLKDTVAACAEYRALVMWGSRADDTPEIVEARAYLEESGCAAGGR